MNSFVLDFNTENASRVRRRTKNCWEARISNPLLKKEENFYSDNEDSCKDWVNGKRTEIIKTMIDKEPDSRVREALIVKYLKGEAQ
jgi:hypothetical protein